MALQLLEEAQKCLQCKKPLCQEGCPVHTDIPHAIALLRQKQLEEAGRLLFDNNPLSLVCAIVCDHEQQCTGHCILNRKGNPVHFGQLIESYISDEWLDSGTIPCEPRKGVSTAVIGGGPAGMTAAILLYQAGFNVTLFEERDDIGGIPRYAIPPFRLSRRVMERYRDKLLKLGIKIRTNVVIGGSLEIADLVRDGYAAVFIATGVWRAKALGIRGESLANVHYGLDYLAHPDSYRLGERVAIIGMGNAAMDVARTALRGGCRHVTLYGRQHSSMKSAAQECILARLEGAEFVFGRYIHEINEKGPVFQVAKVNENDEITGYETELEQVEADSTIISISNGPKNKLVLTTKGLQSNQGGLLITDENGQTTIPGVFAAGDVVTGAKTVVHAVAAAKTAAAAMIRYLSDPNRTPLAEQYLRR